MFERLLPAGEPTSAAALLAEAALPEQAAADRPYLFMNFVSTLDGRAAIEGRTRELGSDADLEMLLALRTVADAVLIGSGTVRIERYARLVGSAERRAARVEAGLAPDPPAVLITRTFALPWDAGLFAAPEQPILIYAPEALVEPPDVAAPLEIVRLPDPSPAAALADLRARGVRALLCEGGPHLHRSLLATGLVDELFLTLTPVVTGDDAQPAIVAGGKLPDRLGLELRWVLRGGTDLFMRYAVTR